MASGTDEVDHHWFEETLEDLRSHVKRWPGLAFTNRISAELEDGERELELARRSGRDIGIDADPAATQRVIAVPEDESLDTKTALETLAGAQVETGFALKELFDGILLPASNPPRRRGLRALLSGDPEPGRGTELMRAHLDGGDPHHAAADFVSPRPKRDAA